MDTHRKEWNVEQQVLRQALTHMDDLQKTTELFLNQHAMVHSMQMSNAGLWSFQDEVLDSLSDSRIRQIPGNLDHSIAWILWHLTRCEDITMNLLVAGSPQVLLQEGRLKRLKTKIRDTGNAMRPEDMADFNASVNLEALLDYRIAVGRQTREIVRQLPRDQFRQKVAPARLDRIRSEKAVAEAASGLLDYWGGLTIAGLLLMPPTRHNFVHWNEALRIKQKI